MSELPSELQRLHILLNCVERNESRKVMCQLLNISNSAMGRKLQRLKAKGLIEQIHSRPTATYKLTSLGSQVNLLLIQSDSMKDFYKCHHKIVGYKIEDYGNWKFNEKLWITMKGNWHYQKVRIKDHQIRVQDTGKIIIICPKIYARTPGEAFGKMVEDAQSIAIGFARNYGMKLGDFIEVREGHKELIGSNQIADMLGYMKAGNVWIDASGGSKNFEELEKTDSIEKLLQMPDVIEKQLVPAIEQHSKDIQMHMVVLGEMRDAIKELRDVIKGMK